VPLFIDVHERLPEGMTARDIAELRRKDVEVRQRHGVRYLRYWVDEDARKMFCLVDAATADAVAAVHREAHSLLADRIFKVKEGS
jgi:Protein of unknown function (DUF4242)